MKKIILILIFVCLSRFVLAEDNAPHTYCGDGICESLEATEGNCCEDCGDCMGVVVDKVQTVDVVEKEVVKTVNVVEKDVVKAIDGVEKEIAGTDEETYVNNEEAIEKREEKKSIFGTIIGFFKRIFGIDTDKDQSLKDITSLKSEEIIAKGGEELKTGKINGNESTGHTGNLNQGSSCGNGICETSERIENNCCEDCRKGGCGSLVVDNQIVDNQAGGNQVDARPENCGDKICDDWTETSTNCPQDCGFDGVEIVDDEDEFKKNYDDIMAEMKDIIPEVPEKQKLLDISSFYTPSATCYFSAGASLANYMEDLSYDEFIWYGRPLHFQYDTRWDTLRTGVGGGELTFESFYNLGYKAYVGRTTKMYLPTPERLHMMASRNFIFFDTDEEALDFIKRLLSADIPVMINLQVGTTPDFLFIKGYDETHIFIPPYVDYSTGEYILSDEKQLFSDEAIENKDTQSLTYEQFFSLWEKSGNTFYWFVKNDERKTEQEIFQINKKDAEEAYDNVQKFIADLDFEVHTSGEDQITGTAAASRYLTKQGYAGLGKKYMELAALYDKQRNQWQTMGIYAQTAELYQEAAELW
ncbi:MAG: hypothetical protein KJ709_00725 [Nanoarchaeota archaeon]|nr:hypothetical protein [Nanoarchaeota archaeon]